MAITYHAGRRIQGLEYTSTQQDLTTGTTDAGTNSTIRGFGNQIKSAHAIVGSTLTKVEVSFKTAMTGTATVGVWDSSNNLKLTLGTKDLSTLTGSEAYYTFDTGSVTMEADWIIGFQISGTATNTSVTVRTNGTNADANIDAYNYNSSSGWTSDGATREYNMKIHYNNGGDEKPTNVQEGSRFEETDTRKMYNSITSVDTEDVYDEITGRTDVSVWITKESPNWSNGEGRYIGLQINDNAGGQALVGKGVKKIKVRLYRGTALTGTYRVGIMDSSGTVKGYSDHNASEVTGSTATYSHTMNNAVILAVGDVIFVSYTATTNALNLRTNDIYPFGSSYNGAFSPRSITTGDTNWVTVSGGDANRLYMMDFDFAPATDQSVPLTWQEIGS